MFRTLVTFFTGLCFTILTALVPGMATQAAAGGLPGIPQGWPNWANFASQSYNWENVYVLGSTLTKVSIPRTNWSEIAQIAPQPGGGFNLQMIQGERWITLNQQRAGMLGLASSQVGHTIHKLPDHDVMVMGIYSPERAELHVVAEKIEKGPDGYVRIYMMEWTPWYGRYWERARSYLDSTEALDPDTPGYNPFHNFEGSSVTDPIFHNISPNAAEVVVGQAARFLGAPWALIAQDHVSFQQWTSSKSGLFKSSVTQHVNAYAVPQWEVGLPIEAQEHGNVAAICVVNYNGGTGCDEPDHVASSGMSFEQWSGGDMPEQPTLIYQYTHTQSSWSVLAFTVLTFVLTYGLASFAGPALASALGSSLSPITVAAATAGTYAIANTVFKNGYLTSPQASYFGSVSNGILNPTQPGGAVQTGTQAALASHWVDQEPGQLTDVNGNLVNGGVNQQYSGNCPVTYTAAQCQAAGLNPGTIARTDDYRQANTVLDMRQRFYQCQQQGLTGAALEKCAAPQMNPLGAPGSGNNLPGY